ncbi:TetR/AcrR family transcriptional regulator [Asticcacaulis machinosus]|uniref:TetR/AcrR family transcriptional regulator n=1 Tax=Asticcacaulis machinosus TaxID=2984211 RepID=A0ABT5HIW0_9CAUL|nr:TetR/AcrR family transcriptional regulator [Asticcacaulis machinosus]MDC7675534.1 TetR/AcrR family transcriptional regulator [Asticcacaulis machinosus]
MQKAETPPPNDQPNDKAASPRVRGRPRAFDREAALSKAMRLFWCKGFAATSISDLTEDMGIGSPSLYAAFGSKEALYAEALRYYVDSNDAFAWGAFRAAPTAREAVEAYLTLLASALTGELSDMPRGCMVTLSAVGSEGYPELGERVREERSVAYNRLKDRLEKGIADGDLPLKTDARPLARFIQTIVAGMSILARDGASREDLEGVVRMAFLGWEGAVRNAQADVNASEVTLRT